jgi:hypothetical protein
MEMSREPAVEWERWLREWNGQLLARVGARERDAFRDPAVTPEVIASEPPPPPSQLKTFWEALRWALRPN